MISSLSLTSFSIGLYFVILCTLKNPSIQDGLYYFHVAGIYFILSAILYAINHYKENKK